MQIIPMPFEAVKMDSLICGAKTCERRPICGKSENVLENNRLAVGDIIAVQESWAVPSSFDYKPVNQISQELKIPVWYRTRDRLQSSLLEHRANLAHLFKRGLYRSPESMPLWAVRFFLQIEAVCVEKLHGITSERALSEGVIELAEGRYQFNRAVTSCYDNPLAAYIFLWDCLYTSEAYRFESNPDVLSVEFRLCDKPDWL